MFVGEKGCYLFGSTLSFCWVTVSVDTRLDLINGQQITNLTADDAPYVGKALTAVLRGKATISRLFVNNIPMVRMYGPGIEVRIRVEDWLKIAAYVANGVLDTMITEYPIPKADPKLDLATIDQQDVYLYRRIVGILVSLFPTRYPRSLV